MIACLLERCGNIAVKAEILIYYMENLHFKQELFVICRFLLSINSFFQTFIYFSSILSDFPSVSSLSTAFSFNSISNFSVIQCFCAVFAPNRAKIFPKCSFLFDFSRSQPQLRQFPLKFPSPAGQDFHLVPVLNPREIPVFPRSTAI